MTSGQVEAIEAMSLTEQDIASLMADPKIVGSASQQDTSAEASSSGPQGEPDGGMLPAVMAGGDPAMGMGGQTASGASSTGSAIDATTVASNMGTPPALLDALIRLLQSKTA